MLPTQNRRATARYQLHFSRKQCSHAADPIVLVNVQLITLHLLLLLLVLLQLASCSSFFTAAAPRTTYANSGPTPHNDAPTSLLQGQLERSTSGTV
jgi:hypothetical protein